MLTLSHSERLRGKLQLGLPALVAATETFSGHPKLAEIYPEYLCRLHGIIRASVPLMEAALAQSRQRTGEDAVAAELVPYLAQHIEEERHHDEWLLEDLARLGQDPAVV